MGNITTKSVGNFQANVGTVSSDIGVMISYVVAVILIITAIGFAILSFIPMKPGDCEDLNTLKSNLDYSCSSSFNAIPEVCEDAKKEYQEESQRCNTKTKPTWLLLFLLLIPLAVLIVFFSKWWNHYVHTNKTAAQIGGTLFELQTMKNLF